MFSHNVLAQRIRVRKKRHQILGRPVETTSIGQRKVQGKHQQACPTQGHLIWTNDKCFTNISNAGQQKRRPSLIQKSKRM